MSTTPQTGGRSIEYNLPRNDTAEHARLNDQAAALKELMHGTLIHTPLTSPRKILDIGCGTGTVTRHLATLYPTATIYGIDISSVPPSTDTADNITYITGDIKQLAGSDEHLQYGSVDYIFQRLLVCGMTSWAEYITQMTSLLRPGGYFEMHDYAYIWYKNGKSISDDWEWMKQMHRGAERLGLDLEIGVNAKKYLEDAGLVDVKVIKYDVPFGTWMVGEKPETRWLGEHQAEYIRELLGGSALPGVTRELGIAGEVMERLKGECKRDLRGEEGKYWCFYVTSGRKL